MNGKRHRWTDEELEIIRRDYQHTNRSRDELAIRLRVTKYAVAGQVRRMGLARHRGKTWSDSDNKRLLILLETYCPEEVARRMHRSVSSIVGQAKRLGVRRRARNSWFTEKDVSEILGQTAKWVRKRIDTGQIVATYHNGHHPSTKGLSMWHIDEADLRDYIRTYPQELMGRNVDMIMIVDILAGVSDKNIEK